MNKIAEQIANFLGSAWVVIPFGLWMVIHTIISRDYISFISELAIEIGLLILRAETAQAERMERQNKKIIKEVK